MVRNFKTLKLQIFFVQSLPLLLIFLGPRYLEIFTVSKAVLLVLMSKEMPWVVFIISLAFLALIFMPYAEASYVEQGLKIHPHFLL